MVQSSLAHSSDNDMMRLFQQRPTPIEVAKQNGHDDLAVLLTEMFPDSSNTAAAATTDTLSPSVVSSTPSSSAPSLSAPSLASATPGSVDESPLHKACSKGLLSEMKSLLTNGADPKQVDSTGRVPLHIAAQQGYANIVRHLVRVCPSCVNMQESTASLTPLHLAANSGKLEVVRVLCAIGSADGSMIDSKGRTPLHYASEKSNLRVVAYLLKEQKCSPSVTDKAGHTPLDLAVQANAPDDVIKLLGGIPSEVHRTSEVAEKMEAAKERETGNEERESAETDGDGDDFTGLDQLLSSFMERLGGQLGLPSEMLEQMGLRSRTLHAACFKGDFNRVKSLIQDDNVDVNGKDDDGHTPVIVAAHAGHTEIVQYLSSLNDCNVGLADNSGRNAIHAACQAGHTNIVTVLLQDSQCDFMHEDKEGTVPLDLAAFNGYLDILKLLAGQRNCDQHHADHKGRSALHCASQEGHLSVAKCLVEEYGLDPMQKDRENGITSLHLAASKGHIAIVRLFCSQKTCDVEILDFSGRTPFYRACQFGRIEIAKVLVEEFNANPLAEDKNRSIGTFAAAVHGHMAFLRYLSTLSAIDFNHVDNSGRTCVHIVSQLGNLEVIKFLVEECGCDSNAVDTAHQVAPLHLAANNGHIDCVKFFCSRQGCQPDSKDVYGRSPLHYACDRGYIIVVRYLVTEQHCDPQRQDLKGISPVMMAALHDKPATTFLLSDQPSQGQSLLHRFWMDPTGFLQLAGGKVLVEEFGLAIGHQDEDGHTPIHNVAHEGHLALLKYFASRHYTKDKEDFKGRTPLHYASQNNHPETVRYLKRSASYAPTASAVQSGGSVVTVLPSVGRWT